MDKVVNFEGNGRGEAVEALEDWGTLSQRCTFTNIFGVIVFSENQSFTPFDP